MFNTLSSRFGSFGSPVMFRCLPFISRGARPAPARRHNPRGAVIPPRPFRTWINNVETTTLSFQDALTDETGGVAGIALWTQGLKQAADAADAPMFDNVRVWHDGELVYENDFATRRYRQLAPAATTAGAYAPVPTTNAVLSAHYDHGSWENDYGVEEAPAGLLVPEAGTNGEDCEGWDGWRRRAGGAGFSLLDPNKNGGYGWANGTVLRVTKKNTLGVLAVPLGQAVTNGKVRLRFDLMPGRKSVLGNYTEAFAMCFLSGGGMGEAAYTGSTSRDTIWKGKAVCGAGYYINGPEMQEANKEIPIAFFRRSNLTPGDTIHADMFSISPDYIYFVYSILVSSGSNPMLGAPANVISNILPEDKAVGWFYTASVVSASVVFDGK